MDKNLGDTKIDVRKYAILCWALARTRGTLYSFLHGDLNGDLTPVKEVLEATSLNKLAERFGYNESDLAIDWSQYLTSREMHIY
jgi:hypothetical protein